MKRHVLLIGLGLALVMLFLGAAAKFYQIGFIQQLDAIFYDYRLRLTMPRTVDERIVILDIDEKSLKEEGRWPWSRDHMALLMDKLFDRHGVAVAGFDVVFAEKDESSGLKVLQELGRNQLKGVPQFHAALAQIRPQLEYDSLFASKIKNRKVVLGYYFTRSKQGEALNVSGALPDAVFPPGMFGGRPISFTLWDGYGANLPQLQNSAASAGYFNALADADGVVRRVPMIAEYNGAYYESLSLAMVRAVLGFPKLIPGYASGNNAGYAGLEWLEMNLPQGGSLREGNGEAVGRPAASSLRGLRIPVDSEVSTLAPYRGGQGSFRYISVADVLHDRVPVAELKNKIVLLGTSAPGLLDMRSTPVGSVYPGVEIHANMIAGILDQNLKQKPPYVDGAEVVLLLIAGVALSLLLPLLGPLQATLLALMSLLAAVTGNVAIWHYAGLALPLASGVLMILGLFTLNMSYGYFVAAHTKR